MLEVVSLHSPKQGNEDGKQKADATRQNRIQQKQEIWY